MRRLIGGIAAAALASLAAPSQAQQHYLSPPRLAGVRAEDVRRVVYVYRDGGRILMASGRNPVRSPEPAHNPQPLPVPPTQCVVVEGDGLREVAAAFLKALHQQDTARGKRLSTGVEDSVILYVKPQGDASVKAVAPVSDNVRDEVEPTALYFQVVPTARAVDGPAMEQAFGALSRWQARKVSQKMRLRLQATFPASVAGPVVKATSSREATPEGRPASAPVAGVVVQVEERVCPVVEAASDPTALRALLEALCRLDDRAFAWTKGGQVVLVRLVAPDGTEEVYTLHVAVHAGDSDARYPGISRAMADPPLPRPLWEMVYARIYGDKEP